MKYTNQECYDIMTTGVELNNLNYWLEEELKQDECLQTTRDDDLLVKSIHFRLKSGRNKTINQVHIKKAINDILDLDGYPGIKTQIATRNIDAEGADCIIQQALFGEIIYG